MVVRRCYCCYSDVVDVVVIVVMVVLVGSIVVVSCVINSSRIGPHHVKGHWVG